MKRTLLLLTVALGLSACETVEGFGEDVSAGGRAIEDASNEVQSDL